MWNQGLRIYSLGKKEAPGHKVHRDISHEPLDPRIVNVVSAAVLCSRG